MFNSGWRLYVPDFNGNDFIVSLLNALLAVLDLEKGVLYLSSFLLFLFEFLLGVVAEICQIPF